MRLLHHGQKHELHPQAEYTFAVSTDKTQKQLGNREESIYVAQANKTARIAWAVLARNESYRP